MRILVMGGTRFIGVYLTQLLVEQGDEVVFFDRGKKPSPVEGLRVILGNQSLIPEKKIGWRAAKNSVRMQSLEN